MKPKLVITRIGSQVTGVYLDPSIVGQVEIEDLDYNFELSESDTIVEQMIDEQKLIKIQ